MQITKKQIEEFNNNPTIKYLGQFPTWTISIIQKKEDGKLGKIPVNASAIIKGQTSFHKSEDFCSPQTPGNMLTLPELNSNPKLYGINRTWHVDAKATKVFAIDIENDLNSGVVENLMKLPFLYLEESVSGGLHGLLPFTDELQAKYPMLVDTTVVKQRLNADGQDLGTFEVFFKDHFITLTKATKDIPPVSKTAAFEFLDQFLQGVEQAKDKSLANQGNRQVVKGDTPEISEIISDSLTDQALDQLFRMSPINYDGGDLSKYENAVVYKAANLIKHAFLSSEPMMTMNVKKKYHKLSVEELSYAIYLTVKKVVSYRKKHDSKRNGMPYLLYLSANCVSRLREEERISFEKYQAQKQKQTVNNVQ
ncbi:hypothetical protein [Ligilactobacillus equi]|nr:hypothetical protein [Ligilactobacillus equi]KRL78132.1 hypothetical protein FC36_GL001182 [Ligilactobacillus equi DSM 15833 = JCM 10991]